MDVPCFHHYICSIPHAILLSLPWTGGMFLGAASTMAAATRYGLSSSSPISSSSKSDSTLASAHFDGGPVGAAEGALALRLLLLIFVLRLKARLLHKSVLANAVHLVERSPFGSGLCSSQCVLGLIDLRSLRANWLCRASNIRSKYLRSWRCWLLLLLLLCCRCVRRL